MFRSVFELLKLKVETLNQVFLKWLCFTLRELSYFNFLSKFLQISSYIVSWSTLKPEKNEIIKSKVWVLDKMCDFFLSNMN